MSVIKEVQPGLYLALNYIDSKIRSTLDLSRVIRATDTEALNRIEGAVTALTQVRERIVRALGPDAE